MTDVDTSFYPRPEPLNPLTVFGQLQSTGGQMLHNQGAQAELQYKNALNQAVQASIDPKTGLPDVYKVNKLMSTLPQGGRNLLNMNVETLPLNTPEQVYEQTPQGLQPNYYARQGLQQSLNPSNQPLTQEQQQAVDEAHDKLDGLYNAASGLANSRNPTQSDAINSFITLRNDGHLSTEDLINTMTDPNNPLPEGNNPQELRQYGAINAQKILQHKQNLPPRSQPQPPNNGSQLPPGQPSFQESMLHPGMASAGAAPQPAASAAPVTPQTPAQNSPTPQGNTTSQAGPLAGLPHVAAGIPQVGAVSPLPASQVSYNNVVASATTAPAQVAAYNEVTNLINAGAKTGTSVADAYQYLASKVPGVSQGITDKAAQGQEIQKFLATALVNSGVPPYAAEVENFQHANLNTDQLPEAIKKMAPFFKAVAEGAKAKQAFYNQVTKNGTDLTQEPAANQFWNQHYDPRWVQYSDLKGAEAKSQFLQTHPDLQDSFDNYKILKQARIVGQ